MKLLFVTDGWRLSPALRMALLLVGLIISVLGWPHPLSAQADPSVVASNDYVPGEIIVGMRSGVDGMQAAAARSDLTVDVVDAFDLPVTEGTEVIGAMPVVVLQVPPGQEAEAILRLQQDPAIAFAEPNWMVYAADEVVADTATAEPAYPIDDPLYVSHQWSFQRSNFSRAWQMAGQAASLTQVRVAVIDSGVDASHPDLAGHLLVGTNYVTPGSPPDDDYGHGTHVTGVIAALTNNGLGMMGGAPRVKVAPYKVLGSNGGGSVSNLVKAIVDATDDGADIINMSLEIRSLQPSTLQSLATAVDYAHAEGVLMVAAAGNSYGAGLYYPAKLDKVMAIAALTVDNEQPSYGPEALAGETIDLAAGGGDASVRVLSLWPKLLGDLYDPVSLSNLSKCPDAAQYLIKLDGAYYCGEYGTSMATPHVTAGAALLLSLNPSLSHGQLRSILVDTAQPIGLPVGAVGGGLLDVAAAVRYLLPPDITFSPPYLISAVDSSYPPFTTTVTLFSPSLQPLTVTTEITDAVAWFNVTNVNTGTASGVIAADHPAYLNIMIDPAELTPGVNTNQLPVIGQAAEQLPFTRTFETVVGGFSSRVLLAAIFNGSGPSGVQTDLFSASWEEPISSTVYLLGNSGSIQVLLPFTFPLPGPNAADAGDYSYDRMSIFADGFVAFAKSGAVSVADPGQNHCLPSFVDPQQAVFGWWADLNGGAPGAEISTFKPGPDRFVVQYSNVPTAVGVTPAYKVTFQIVLYRNGDIRLNYRNVPNVVAQEFQKATPNVTIGVVARSALFHNGIACRTASQTEGTLPLAGDSILIRSEEVF